MATLDQKSGGGSTVVAANTTNNVESATNVSLTVRLIMQGKVCVISFTTDRKLLGSKFGLDV